MYHHIEPQSVLPFSRAVPFVDWKYHKKMDDPYTLYTLRLPHRAYNGKQLLLIHVNDSICVTPLHSFSQVHWLFFVFRYMRMLKNLYDFFSLHIRFLYHVCVGECQMNGRSTTKGINSFECMALGQVGCSMLAQILELSFMMSEEKELHECKKNGNPYVQCIESLLAAKGIFTYKWVEFNRWHKTLTNEINVLWSKRIVWMYRVGCKCKKSHQF